MPKLSLYSTPPADRAPIDVARSYIAAGIPVFPCHETNIEELDQSTGEVVERAEKSPRTPNGLKNASTSSRIIDIWFGKRYPNAVIGVPTGEQLGAWVLDLDRHGDRDGHKWLAEMEAKHGPLPPTARANTANGGTHIFFRHVDGVRNRAAVAPGVDTRGEGGYIVGPGSRMADGRAYAWDGHDGPGMPEIAEAPKWLLDMIVGKPTPAPQQTEYVYRPSGNEAYVERAVESELERLATTPVGGRGAAVNASAYSLGQLVAAGVLSRSDAEAGLLSAAISNGIVAKDGQRKVEGTIKRGLEKGMLTPRQIPERSYDNDNTPSLPADRMVENKLKKEAAANDDTAVPEAAPQGTKPRARERFEKTWFDEIEEGAPKETIIKGALGAGEFTTISGLPGTGKSVIVTDMACHIAAGMEWHGRRIKQGLVVYVAAERKKLTERRMMAFRQHHGVRNVPLLVIGGRLDFTKDLKDARDLIAVIREAETITGMPCVWVIIDTLTRVFGAGDQNASKDMTRFVQSCDEILAETKAHVTAIHHSAWSGERGKGAIDLDGAVDASFMVKKDHNKYRLVCDGTNDGEDGDVLAFEMKSIQIGVDEDGQPTTAPVVVPISGETKPMNSGSLKGFKGDVLEALHRAIEKHGIEPEGHAFPDDILVVDEQTWRTEFYAGRDLSNAGAAETARKQFQRAPKSLVSEGHVTNIGLWYWPS